jgi:SAM-dependent methyltransferase
MSEQTYRNPLFGRRVDRYIPPELRQGLGALLAGADMLNPVSAYREYLKDVREGDVVGGVTNAAGFVAPGVASAVASRLARPALSAVAPYGEDAARVLMEVLSPTGAPEVSRVPMDMSRREFLGGLGAVGTAAATAKLPVDEMLEGLGRAGVRGGAGLSGRLGALSGLRGKMGELDEFLYEPSQLKNALSRTLDDLERAPNILADREAAMARENLSRETRSRLGQFEESYGPMFTERAATKDMISNERGDLISDIIGDPDAFADELGDLSDDELRLLAVEINDFAGSAGIEDLIDEDMFMDNMGKFVGRLESEASRRGLRDVGVGGLREYFEEFSDAGSGGGFGSMLPDVTSRMVSGGDEFRRGLGSFDFPSPEVSQRTQIAGTLPTYRKALEVFDEVAPEGSSLDYGAGLGKSSELGFDTFEPYAREGFEPTYRSASEIPDASYDRVTNLNVLNVVDPDARRGIVLDIGRILKPDGVAIITTRGRDVLNAKGRPGPEDMSIVTSAGTYQKGFTRAELVDYLRGTLGEGFEVNPLQLGPAGATVRKLPVRPD